MKLILAGLSACLLGNVVYLFTVSWLLGENLSKEDLISMTTVLSVASLLALGLIVTPGMFWVRKKFGGYAPAFWFPLSALLFLGIPALIMLSLGFFVFGSVTAIEACLFFVVFLIIGAAFGYSFLKLYGRSTN